MKILKWLCRDGAMNSVNGIALVQVEPNEHPDVEDFLALVDGNSVGHFGFSVDLVGSAMEGRGVPEVKPEFSGSKRYRRPTGYHRVQNHFGHPRASELKKLTRWYKVFVHRD